MDKDFTGFHQENDIQIGYILGSNKILFIKTGQGGTIYGDNNRYLKLANKINTTRGFSVFVSATTFDSQVLFQKDIEIVEKIFGTAEFGIYYLGVSKGGLIGIWHGSNEPRIVKMISINAPLMINYHGKTLPGVKKLGIERLTMIYGSLDPSYKYVPFVEKHANVVTVERADHNLKNTTVSIYELVSKYLLPE